MLYTDVQFDEYSLKVWLTPSPHVQFDEYILKVWLTPSPHVQFDEIHSESLANSKPSLLEKTCEMTQSRAGPVFSKWPPQTSSDLFKHLNVLCICLM